MLDDVIEKAKEVLETDRDLSYNMINESVQKMVEVVNLILGVAGIIILVFMLLRTLIDILILEFPILQDNGDNMRFLMSKDCEAAMKVVNGSPIATYLKMRAKTYLLTAILFILTFGGMFDAVQKSMTKIITNVIMVLMQQG